MVWAKDEMSILVLSPHRDDAAFSCGLLLSKLVALEAPLRIANVCTISDYAPYADVTGAIDLVAKVTRLRAREDEAFVQHLEETFGIGQAPVELLDLAWKDAPLRHAIATEEVLDSGAVPKDEILQLSTIFRLLAPASIVLAPMALGGHIDHRLVREAAVNTWSVDELLFYEDLPYACRMTFKEREEQKELALPWPCECAQMPSAQSGDKRRMALCYSSQIAPQVADEMENYGEALGWTECLNGNEAALQSLAALSASKKVSTH